MPATVMLVHWTWHGAWCWEKVADELRARGVTHRDDRPARSHSPFFARPDLVASLLAARAGGPGT